LKARVSRKAIASVLVGTFLIVICLIGGIGDRSDTLLFAFLIAAPANLALALSAFRDINRNPVQLGGHRLATAGLLSLPLCLLVGLLLPPHCRLGASPNTEARMNLTMLGLAFHNFHQEHGHFPASAIRAPDGKPLLSWRVAILPYVEEEELYKLFHLDEPWDSPHNLTLLERLPAVFADASFKRFDGLTRFQVYVGPGTAFDRPDGAAVFFRDGAAKTVLITEGEQRVPWTKPIDLPFGPEVVLVRPHVRDLCTGKGSWVLSVDGEVHAVPVDCPEEVLRALITRNGGEEVEWPK